jgi:hypothetical protein
MLQTPAVERKRRVFAVGRDVYRICRKRMSTTNHVSNTWFFGPNLLHRPIPIPAQD